MALIAVPGADWVVMPQQNLRKRKSRSKLLARAAQARALAKELEALAGGASDSEVTHSGGYSVTDIADTLGDLANHVRHSG